MGDRARSWWPPPVWASYVALLVVLAVDNRLPADVVLVPYYFIVVVATSIWARPRAVVLLAATAFALALVVAGLQGNLTRADFWIRITAMLAFTAIALTVARIGRTRERRLAEASRLMTEVVNGTDQPLFAKDYTEQEGARGRYLFGNEAELGCPRAQGWLYGRAVPFDDPSWAALPVVQQS